MYVFKFSEKNRIIFRMTFQNFFVGFVRAKKIEKIDRIDAKLSAGMELIDAKIDRKLNSHAEAHGAEKDEHCSVQRKSFPSPDIHGCNPLPRNAERNLRRWHSVQIGMSRTDWRDDQRHSPVGRDGSLATRLARRSPSL